MGSDYRVGLLHKGPVQIMLNCCEAAVYLKNRVSRGWAPVEDIPMHKPIPPQDKDDFRNRLLPILASSTPQVRAQLLPSLEKILRHDFPAQWPNFVDVAQQLLGTADAASVLSGLHCFLALSRTYRLKGNSSREEYDQVVQASFPRLLSIGSRLVDENSPEAWEMLHTIFKTFKHAIYVSEGSFYPTNRLLNPTV